MNARRDQRDDQAVADVLAELRALRLRLSADLATASGALDTDEPAVAADIISGGSDDLRRFVVDSRDRLQEAAAGTAAGTPAPVDGPAHRRRSGWRRALPAVPAVAILAASAAAAAVVAPRIGEHTDHHAAATRSASVVSRPAGEEQTAPEAFRQLRSAIITHASAREVLTAAQHWHRHLAALIASSSNDPHRLGLLISLLQQETSLLRTHHVPDAGVVLAAANRLEQHLLQTAAPLLSSLPAAPQLPTSTSTGQPVRHHATSSPPRPFAAPSHHPSKTSVRSTRPSPSHSPSTPPPSTKPSRSWTPPWEPSSPVNGLFGKKS